MIPSCLSFPDEIGRVDALLSQTVRQADGLLARVADYARLGGGKKLRPRIVVLVARALNGATPATDERMIRAAACMELVHCASLIHDDVIDKAAMRRGRPSVNAKFGEDVAILMADLLFSEAFDLALAAVDPEILRLVCRVTRKMCEGEIFQIERRDAVLTEPEYLRIIESKTAALLSACAEMGALVAGQTDPARRQALARFGLEVGMAYQITDDALDYTADSEQWGKRVGADLSQGKQTLPLVHTFEKASPDDREALLRCLANGRELEQALPLIRKYGGLEYASGRAREFAGRARSVADGLRLDASLEPFQGLCDFVVERLY